MTIKLVEEHWCDRCNKPYKERREGFANTTTMAIGWFRFRNGSGSKNSSPPNRRWENLDYDLCMDCTEAFRLWWQNPPREDQQGATTGEST